MWQSVWDMWQSVCLEVLIVWQFSLPSVHHLVSFSLVSKHTKVQQGTYSYDVTCYMQLETNKTGNVHTNVTSKGVRVTTVAVAEQNVLNILSVCVCVLSYPACNACAPYCIVICGLPRSTIFST